MDQTGFRDILRKGLPYWDCLSAQDQNKAVSSAKLNIYKPKTIIPSGTDDLSPGIQVLRQGMARVFISSPDGKQLTLKRILPGDVYTFGISGLLDPPGPLSIETESACEFLVIPRSVCRELCGSPAVKDVLIREMQHRFSQVLRIMESVAFSGMGARLANELIEQSHFASSSMFAITHERIAADLGTAREVVTRLLNQFQQDGVVALLRGRIEILKMKELIQIRGEYLGEVSRTIYPDLY